MAIRIATQSSAWSAAVSQVRVDPRIDDLARSVDPRLPNAGSAAALVAGCSSAREENATEAAQARSSRTARDFLGDV